MTNLEASQDGSGRTGDEERQGDRSGAAESDEVTVGLLPAPELPEELVERIAAMLPDRLAHEVDAQVTWRVETRCDPLIGAGGSADVIAEAETQRRQQGWDLAVAVTDLPLRGEDQVVVADVSERHEAAVLSLPALGTTRLRARTAEAITSLVRDLHVPSDELSASPRLTSARIPSRRITEPDSDMESGQIDIRYALRWKTGHAKLVTGMVRANRPWEVLTAFKGALAATFGTAAYALIFPSAPKLSTAMGFVRPLLIMILAVVVLVAWTVVAHHLWERPQKGRSGQRTLTRLYNTVTVVTIGSVTFFGYVVLFCIIVGLAYLFVPVHYFASEVAPAPGGVLAYLHLAWLLASLAMLAAALGQGLDDDETVRKATFGYRQMIRARQQEQQDRSGGEGG